jgi:predicted alpha/beta superfamily hydrolase
VELKYDTYESTSYDLHKKILHKRAYVYLPYGYNEETQYNVFYLMHGDWSDESAWLGAPHAPNVRKNVIDHAMANGEIQPMILVMPTYNNESPADSSDYSLSFQLTDNYRKELLNDLIPAVEDAFSTYTTDFSPAGLKASRDHRGFGGFSMGAIITWRIFQYGLSHFRYFLPMSGAFTTNGSFLASAVEKSGLDWNDFFIFAGSGGADFAYPGFLQQIEAMANDKSGMFRLSYNEDEGNLAFLVRETAEHSYEHAMEYVYNGLRFFWNAG